MADEPRFPSAEEARAAAAAAKSAYRSSDRLPTAEPRESARLVVRRAEPLAEDDAKAKAKLTPDEVRALLAVDAADRPPAAKTFFHRGRIIAIPTGLISVAAHLLFGKAGPYIEAIVAVAALVWIAWPALRRRDGWS